MGVFYSGFFSDVYVYMGDRVFVFWLFLIYIYIYMGDRVFVFWLFLIYIWVLYSGFL